MKVGLPSKKYQRFATLTNVLLHVSRFLEFLCFKLPFSRPAAPQKAILTRWRWHRRQRPPVLEVKVFPDKRLSPNRHDSHRTVLNGPALLLTDGARTEKQRRKLITYILHPKYNIQDALQVVVSKILSSIMCVLIFLLHMKTGKIFCPTRYYSYRTVLNGPFLLIVDVGNAIAAQAVNQ